MRRCSRCGRDERCDRISAAAAACFLHRRTAECNTCGHGITGLFRWQRVPLAFFVASPVLVPPAGVFWGIGGAMSGAPAAFVSPEFSAASTSFCTPAVACSGACGLLGQLVRPLPPHAPDDGLGREGAGGSGARHCMDPPCRLPSASLSHDHVVNGQPSLFHPQQRLPLMPLHGISRGRSKGVTGPLGCLLPKCRRSAALTDAFSLCPPPPPSAGVWQRPQGGQGGGRWQHRHH